MPNPEHRKAQDLAEKALGLAQDGNLLEARRLYSDAADLERIALSQIPDDRARTRGILAVSLVALLHKANEWENLRTISDELLSDEALPEFAIEQIKEIVEATRSLSATGGAVHTAFTGTDTGSPADEHFDLQNSWTNPSVLNFAQGDDPIESIRDRTREVVLAAIDDGWSGPPFDPFELAELRGIPVETNNSIADARTVPLELNRFRIEYNPDNPPYRVRFSISHEITHTLFPDCAETMRNRMRYGDYTLRGNDWELESLCNIGASEILMPDLIESDLLSEPLNIHQIMPFQSKYEVSAETLLMKICEVTSETCAMFAATRVENGDKSPSFRIEYARPSRQWPYKFPKRRLSFNSPTLEACTTVDWTNEGREAWDPELPEMQLQCVAIPPYPGHRFPRIVGLIVADGKVSTGKWPKIVLGDATEPYGEGTKIICHIVNNQTPRWGAGFGRVVGRKWPEVRNSFVRWANENSNNLKLGNYRLSRISPHLFAFHMIAQSGYGPSQRPRIRYQPLKECLGALANLANDMGASVHMPRIGIGQAGGNWAIINSIIDETLCRNGVDVTVYDLPGTTNEVEQQGIPPL